MSKPCFSYTRFCFQPGCCCGVSPASRSCRGCWRPLCRHPACGPNVGSSLHRPNTRRICITRQFPEKNWQTRSVKSGCSPSPVCIVSNEIYSIYLKITVLCPLSNTRRSACHTTARASTELSTSRPMAVSCATSMAWSARTVPCSMMGPSSRSAVT